MENEEEPASADEGHFLYSDSALTDPGKDELGRITFANRIAEVLADRQEAESLVLGIYGRWGEGKSSVLNFIENRLNDRADVVCTRFNPWLYQGTQQLLISFFETLAQAIEASLTKSKRIGKQLRSFGVALSTVSVGVPGVSITPGSAVEALGEHLASDDVAKQRRKLGEALAASEKKVVVIIDDIDRLEDSEIATLFKIVKLAADFDHVSYVLSFDHEVVSKSLSKKYSWRDEVGESFLEKIVQVPLGLPRASEEVLGAMALRDVGKVVDLAGVNISEADVRRFNEIFVVHLMKSLNTPRTVKRIVNAASFSVPLIGSEVNVADLLVIECFRVLAPTVVRRLQGARDALLGRPYDLHLEGADAFIKGRVEWLVEEVEPELQSGISAVLRDLFPRIERAFSNHIFDDEAAWTKDRRICSSQYFERYFAYGIPPGDISDAEVAAFLDLLDSQEVNTITIELRRLFSIAKSDRVILKLRQTEADISAARAKVLAQVLCNTGGELPGLDAAPIQAAMSPFGQASASVTMLINRLDRSDRREFTEALLLDSSTIPFAAEVLRWVHGQSQDIHPDEVRVLSQADLELITATFAGRLATSDEQRPLFASFPRQAPMLYQWWGQGADYDVIHAALAQQCDGNIDNAVAFVSCFMIGDAAKQTGPLLEQLVIGPMYDLMVKLIDPDVLARTFMIGFDLDNKGPFPSNRSSLSFDERVAMRFVDFHRNRLSQAATTSTDAEASSDFDPVPAAE